MRSSSSTVLDTTQRAVGPRSAVDEPAAEDDGILTTPLLPGWQLAMRTFFAASA